MALSGAGPGMFGGYKEDSQVYVLDTDEAVETCFSEQSVKVGLTASVSLDRVGRSMGARLSAWTPSTWTGERRAAAVHHYRTKGVFLGAGVEVTWLSALETTIREISTVSATRTRRRRSYRRRG